MQFPDHRKANFLLPERISDQFVMGPIKTGIERVGRHIAAFTPFFPNERQRQARELDPWAHNRVTLGSIEELNPSLFVQLGMSPLSQL